MLIEALEPKAIRRQEKGAVRRKHVKCQDKLVRHCPKAPNNRRIIFSPCPLPHSLTARSSLSPCSSSSLNSPPILRLSHPILRLSHPILRYSNTLAQDSLSLINCLFQLYPVKKLLWRRELLLNNAQLSLHLLLLSFSTCPILVTLQQIIRFNMSYGGGGYGGRGRGSYGGSNGYSGSNGYVFNAFRQVFI
jgi:hypothetical protein